MVAEVILKRIYHSNAKNVDKPLKLLNKYFELSSDEDRIQKINWIIGYPLVIQSDNDQYGSYPILQFNYAIV